MISGILYVLCIIAADVFATLWIVPLPFGLSVPAGAFMVAPIFTLRDHVHEKFGKAGAYILIGVASVVSWIVSAIFGSGLLAQVTLASVVAFAVNEVLDTEIYHRLRDRSRLLAILSSNAVSSLVDSVLFIWIAFILSGAVPADVGIKLMIGQYIVKMLISGIVGAAITRND